MKIAQVIMVIALLLSFCSCEKNYKRMVDDRVKQYKSEGKIILNQSNDSTGKEHYIVYGDPNRQVIGIDTLGENPKEINLGEKMEYAPVLYASYDKGLQIISDAERGEQTGGLCVDWNDQLLLNADGSWSFKQPGREVKGEVIVFKDRYLAFKEEGEYGLEKSYVLFFDKPQYYFSLWNGKLNDDGCIEVEYNEEIVDILNVDWQNQVSFFINGNPLIVINRSNGQVSFKYSFSPNGEIIKKDNYVSVGGISIPVEAFSSWAEIKPYLMQLSYKD